MPELIRHTKTESSRLLNGSEGIMGVWMCQTVAGTTTYNMFDVNGCPHNKIEVINAWMILTAAPGAGDTVVVNKLASGVASAITDTKAINALADTDLVAFSDIVDSTNTIIKGQNLQIVTASDALARVFVGYIVTE